ncbi:MAG TPA: chemotaxis-specific protein-glutamate methyltransferase CheB [Polyangiaceae bacterium]|nr:chemotaxis-specific protein-glutamate methyltransferase CheB [Polyangiaceae bacterium]
MKRRVLLVEDSATVRGRLREVLESDPELELVGEACDGKRAIELCQELRPDVVTMDMMLPVMSGLAATEYIMAHCPTPILIVSASINRGEVFKTYEALAAGAVDVLEKPRGDEPDGSWERKYLQTLKLVSRIRVITHPRARLRRPDPDPVQRSSEPPPQREYGLVAIGASTGGPGAIVEVLRGLPPEFRLPVLIVLHISEPFGSAFADWLDTQTARPVAYPSDGDLLSAASGRVVMAPPGRHMTVQNGRLRLTREAERHSCRPSVDVLFESLAHECGSTTAACLLTGMGRDGAAGLLALKRAGALTIAQDEASCVVYGMPREAVLLNAAQRVLPLSEIAPTLRRATGQRAGGLP